MYRVIPILLTVALAVSTVHAEDKYQRKSGLWEVKRFFTGSEDPDRTFQVCVDQSSDNALRQLAGGVRGEACETSKVERNGEELIVDATCKATRTSTATTHAVITGNFESAYKIESASTFDPPIRGKAEGTSLIEAKWLGACKPGQKPGDVMLTSGAKPKTDADRTSDKAGAETSRSSGQQEKKKGRGAYVPGTPVPSTN